MIKNGENRPNRIIQSPDIRHQPSALLTWHFASVSLYSWLLNRSNRSPPGHLGWTLAGYQIVQISGKSQVPTDIQKKKKCSDNQSIPHIFEFKVDHTSLKYLRLFVNNETIELSNSTSLISTHLRISKKSYLVLF